jgi:hypothetical protein
MLAGAFAGLLVCAASATAGVDAYKVQMNPADQMAARAVMLRQSDVGDPFLWESARETPDVSSTIHCRNFAPKVSDIVVTGAAAMRFRQPGLVTHSVSKVFRTERMAELQWRRSIHSPNYVSCVRSFARRSLTPEERFVSFRKLTVPRIGGHSEGYRTLVDVETVDGTVRLAIDTLAASRGRTQVWLTTMIRLTSVPARWPRELALVRTLVGRARA